MPRGAADRARRPGFGGVPGPVAVFSGGGTGGHLFPALALCDALRELRPDVRPFFVGAQKGLEARVLPERGLDHLLLPVLGFQRGTVWGNLRALAGLLRSLLSTGEAFHRLRPGVVVVTGGYAGGPAGILAGLMGIPLALQEQNSFPGLTTRALSRWSRQIHLAFPEALDFLPRSARARARVSGNPIRVPGGGTPEAARAHFGLDPRGPVLLVVGGSQGAEALNRAVLEALQGVRAGGLTRPRGLQILWATGPLKLEEVEAGLVELGRPSWVRALGFIEDMPTALEAATLALSRGSAMATSEFLAWGVPAILVPLPTAAADHQTKNAESLALSGSAVHLPQRELSGALLWKTVTSLLEDPRKLSAMRGAALARGRPQAGREIAEALATLLPGGTWTPPRGKAAA